jgi:hypothetical protein
LGGFFDLPAKRAERQKLEEQIAAPEFWNDQERAQKTVQQRSRVERQIQRQENFESAVSDAEVLFEFSETDADSLTELQNLIQRLEKGSRRCGNRNAARRRTRCEKRDLLDSSGSRRNRRAGLGGDAFENVSALGGKTRFQS